MAESYRLCDEADEDASEILREERATLHIPQISNRFYDIESANTVIAVPIIHPTTARITPRRLAQKK